MELLVIILIYFYNFMTCYHGYRVFSKIKRLLILYYKIYKKIQNNNIRLNKIKFFFKNLKVFNKKKKINIKTFLPIIFILLFADSISLSESNNIHHYLIDNNGKMIEVTNEEEALRIEEEKIKEIIRKKKMEENEMKWFALLIVMLTFFSSLLFILFLNDFFDDDNDDIFIPKDDDDEDTLNEKKKAYFRKYPPTEDCFTTYQKKWVVNNEMRLRDRTNPHYIGTCTGMVYNHFDAKYVDKYNTRISKIEDKKIYKTKGLFCKYKPWEDPDYKYPDCKPFPKDDFDNNNDFNDFVT